MNLSLLNGRLVISLDTDRRAIGFGASFYRGRAFLSLTIELPFALVNISYAR